MLAGAAQLTDCLWIIPSDSFGAFVGVNVGTSITNPPSAKDVVKILKEQQIAHVRLFDSDHQMLSALQPIARPLLSAMRSLQ
ncbi:hypothetical protein ACLOJK_041910 [Asimina triloba]